ncbi:MAG: hypothetical protein ACPG19_15245 [Saprospiraceae bacterium]
MNNQSIFGLLFFVLILVSCQNASEETTNTAQEVATPVLTTNVDTPLPLYPIEKAKDLIAKCDYVDLIFYNLDFSININEPNNAKGIVASVLSSTLPPNTTCKEGFGYMTFQGGGEILAEAEVFFQQGCTYLIFKENNQNVGTCAIPDRGIQFFNNMIQQQQRAKQAQQGQQPAQNGNN